MTTKSFTQRAAERILCRDEIPPFPELNFCSHSVDRSIESLHEVPNASQCFHSALTFAPPFPETCVRPAGGEAGARRGRLLVLVGVVPGPGGVPPQATPHLRREPQLPRPRQGLLRRHRGARAFQTVR